MDDARPRGHPHRMTANPRFAPAHDAGDGALAPLGAPDGAGDGEEE